VGTAGDDAIVGGDGARGGDVLIGDNANLPPFLPSNGTNDDHLIGGSGTDHLFGVGGNEVLEGGSGDHEPIGFGGNDTITGGSGTDFIDGDNPSPPPPDLPFPPGTNNDDCCGSGPDRILNCEITIQ
jgi:Ca2+-binding RTX toxin-like protein